MTPEPETTTPKFEITKVRRIGDEEKLIEGLDIMVRKNGEPNVCEVLGLHGGKPLMHTGHTFWRISLAPQAEPSTPAPAVEVKGGDTASIDDMAEVTIYARDHASLIAELAQAKEDCCFLDTELARLGHRYAIPLSQSCRIRTYYNKPDPAPYIPTVDLAAHEREELTKTVAAFSEERDQLLRDKDNRIQAHKTACEMIDQLTAERDECSTIVNSLKGLLPPIAFVGGPASTTKAFENWRKDYDKLTAERDAALEKLWEAERANKASHDEEKAAHLIACNFLSETEAKDLPYSVECIAGAMGKEIDRLKIKANDLQQQLAQAKSVAEPKMEWRDARPEDVGKNLTARTRDDERDGWCENGNTLVKHSFGDEFPWRSGCNWKHCQVYAPVEAPAPAVEVVEAVQYRDADERDIGKEVEVAWSKDFKCPVTRKLVAIADHEWKYIAAQTEASAPVSWQYARVPA